jgi:type II pantothenate kinase
MIGIDFGATYVDIVVIEEGKLRRAYTELEKNYAPEYLENILRIEVLWKKQRPKRGSVAVTGAKSSNYEVFAVGKKSAHLENIKKRLIVREVGEIIAIAEGAKFLTKKSKCVVANVGTGTPFVCIDGDKYSHIAGTGIGGGTLNGLSELLLDRPVAELELLASKGTNKLDLVVGDLMELGVGKLPKAATASNFGKANPSIGKNSADVAKSLLKMVGETLGVMGALAAKSCGSNEIIFTGRVPEENMAIRKSITEACEMFGVRAIFPENGKYCTAIGAVIAANKNNKK